MFMTEAARGCSRGCTYCVMRRSTNGGMRIVPRDGDHRRHPRATRASVGLVGAAVTDHPDIRAIVRDVVDGGREVGISSLRADKLDDELVGLLARGGYRTLTVAGRRRERAHAPRDRALDARATHLIRSAELARAHGLHTLKVYMMLGVPSETDADVDELVALSRELAADPSEGRVRARAVRRQAQHAARRHRRSRASSSSRIGSIACAAGYAPPGSPARSRSGRPVGALGVGRVHDRAGRDAAPGSP